MQEKEESSSKKSTLHPETKKEGKETDGKKEENNSLFTGLFSSTSSSKTIFSSIPSFLKPSTSACGPLAEGGPFSTSTLFGPDFFKTKPIFYSQTESAEKEKKTEKEGDGEEKNVPAKPLFPSLQTSLEKTDSQSRATPLFGGSSLFGTDNASKPSTSIFGIDPSKGGLFSQTTLATGAPASIWSTQNPFANYKPSSKEEGSEDEGGDEDEKAEKKPPSPDTFKRTKKDGKEEEAIPKLELSPYSKLISV